MKKANEKRAVNLPKLSTTATTDGGDVTPRRPPKLLLESPSAGAESSSPQQTPLALTPILGLDSTLAAPTKPVTLMAPTTPSKQPKGHSLRARKLEDPNHHHQSLSPSSPTSSVPSPGQLYDPTSSTLLNPAYEVDMSLLEAEVDKLRQLGQAAEGHADAIYANNAKERMFFKQASSEIANMEADIVAKRRASVQEKQAWSAEKVEFEALLVAKAAELAANERERAKLSETLTQTVQYFTHEVESRDKVIAAHVAELQTTRDVLSATEHSLRQSQMQHQRAVDTLAKHVDDLDVTKAELATARDVVSQHEISMANQSKHIAATETALAQARTTIASLENKCADQKGTLHAYKEEMHGYVFNVDQLRREIKQGQDKQDELMAVIKGHEKTIAAFKRQQSKWDAAKAAHETEQSEHRAITKMHKERIDAQAKLIHRQEESIVANTVAHLADFTTIDLQAAQLKTLTRTVDDQSAYISKLEATCRAAEIQHLKNRSIVELLQTKIHGLDDVSSRQDKDITSLNERLAKRDTLVAARDAEIAALKASFESMSTELRGQIETNQAVIAVHIGVIEAMRATQESLVAAKSQLETDLDAQMTRAADLDATLLQLRKAFATLEDNYIGLCLRHRMDEASHAQALRELAAWAKATLDERGLELAERNQVLREASEDAAATLAALQHILDETNTSFADCKGQAAATAADYEAKVAERTEALEQQEERIHLLEIQLKMNAEQANQRRQTAHDERQREMAQFQLQLKGKEDVFEIEVSRLKGQIQLERAAALAQLTTLQESSEMELSKVQSVLQQERTAAAATIAQLQEIRTKLTLERTQLHEELAQVRAGAAEDARMLRHQHGMLDEEIRGAAYALAAAAAAQESLVNRHTVFVAQLRADHAACLAKAEAAHGTLVAALQEDHTKATTELRAQHAAFAKQAQYDLASLEESHAAQVAATAEETQRHRLELEAKLQYQRETLTAQLKESKQSYEDQLVEQRVRLECLNEHQREILEGQLRDQAAETVAREAATRATFDAQLAAVKTELEGQLDKLRAGYEAVIAQQRERYDATIRQRKERYELDVATQRAELESALATTKARLEGELADTKLRLETELRTTRETLEGEAAVQKALYESTLRTTRDTLEREHRETKAALEGRLTAVQTTLEAELSRQKERFEGEIAQQATVFEADVADQRCRLECQLAEQKDAMERQLTSQRMEYEAEMLRQRTDLESSLRVQRDELEGQLKTTRSTLEDELAREKATHERSAEDQRVAYEARLFAQDADLTGQLHEWQTKYHDETTSMRARFDHDLTTQRAALEGALVTQKEALETELLQQKAAYETKLARQEDMFDTQMAEKCRQYNLDIQAQVDAFEKHMAERTAAWEAAVMAQAATHHSELQALVQQGEHDQDTAKQTILEWTTRANDLERSAGLRLAALDAEVASLKTQLQGSINDHTTAAKALVEAVAAHKQDAEAAEASITSLKQNVAALEAHVAQCYTGDFLVTRIKTGMHALIQPTFHPNIAEHVATMASLDDVDALLAMLLALAIECQTFVQVGSQRLDVQHLTSIVDEHDSLWAQLSPAWASSSRDIHQVIFHTKEHMRLLEKLAQLVPDIGTPSVDAALAFASTFQAHRKHATAMLATTPSKASSPSDNAAALATSSDILDALQAWQSFRVNVAKALRLADGVWREADVIALVDEYMVLKDKTRDRFQLQEANSTVIFQYLDAYHACLSQGKAILTTEPGEVDAATLLRHVDAYDQLRTQVARVMKVPKKDVDSRMILDEVTEWFTLRGRVASHLGGDAGSTLPTATTIGNTVEAHATLLRDVAAVWEEADPITVPRIVATMQEYHSLRRDATSVLQLPATTTPGGTTIVPRDVIAMLTEYVNLGQQVAKQLELTSPRATARDITDALAAYQTLRADCARLWQVAPPVHATTMSPGAAPASSKRSSASDILAWVQDYHGLRSRVSILLGCGTDGNAELCATEDIVTVVQTYLELAVKHRDLVRAKMAIEANNNALTGNLDAVRQALQDLEMRVAAVGSKHGLALFTSTNPQLFFDALDRKLQDGKDFEAAFHRRKLAHEQDVAAHTAAVATLHREAALAMDALHRDHDTKRQDAERAAAQALAALDRARALQVEDLMTASARQYDDLQRSMAAQLEALQRDLTNARAIKLKEQADYDAIMDTIHRALEAQAADAHSRKDNSEKAAFFARYVDRDRMLMELVYGAIRSVTQLLTPATPKASTMPTELSHAILGCIKELKRMKEYVIGSFDALQKDLAPFLPFEVTWHAVEWRPDMELAAWCVESIEKTNEHARMQFQQFLAHANSTLSMLAATHRERAMEVLAFMRRSAAPDAAVNNDKDANILKMRLMDAVADRDQVGLELQLKETFFQDLLHQHKGIASDMYAKLSQQQQVWKAMMAASTTAALSPPRSPTAKTAEVSAKTLPLTMLKPVPKPKWQEEDPTTTVLSNGRTLKERFVSDLAIETGQNPPMKRGQTAQQLRVNAPGTIDRRKVSQPYVAMAPKNIQASTMSSTKPTYGGANESHQDHLWYQGVKLVDGQSLSLAVAYNPTRNSVVLDVFNTDTESMQAIEVSPKLLHSVNKPLTEFTPIERSHVVDAVLQRLHMTPSEGGAMQCIVADDDL
ncbi:hypothetical protein H310_12117 [Aphanomyces invadans]|uniref:MaoC-like domain-containing protein n=1 Tax=Aphanomyces invadans TaxID=157072 RepID=A0A024TKF6_9STRA|nr:hypothetical protein H310_12117 [Aphanomyces invadans]ETV94101.1 hypothetical protein H310_12117 [Aphanomyces invadans]|eukprot:XP_008877304.1 hypothetical protein H310_12117 [Aphanomyces invadans]